MKLILLESVEGLGRPGDEVSVKAGFARNYLLPQRKAISHSPDALRMLGRLKQKADEEERAMISSMQELADKLTGFRIEVSARATEEGHLFGSVTEKDIHVALTGAGWNVPLRAVRLSAHIKEAIESKVVLHLYGDIEAPITVAVVPIDLEGNVIEPVAAPPEREAEGSEGDDEDAASAPAAGQKAAPAPA